MQVLHLSHDSITGQLPETIGKLDLLQVLDISCNHIAGHMPRTLGCSCNLTDLRLNSNNFNGELTDVVDGWTSPQTHQKATSLKHTFPGSHTWNI
ncbi:unnamed protein product [Musa acuminata var. zebrina]